MQELIQVRFIKINGQLLSVYIQEFYCLKEALSMFMFWTNYADIVYYKQNRKHLGNNISRGFSVLYSRYHENIRLINLHTSCIYINKEERKEENKKENTVVSHCDKRDVAKPFFLQIVTEIEMLCKITPHDFIRYRNRLQGTTFLGYRLLHGIIDPPSTPRYVQKYQ